MLRAKHEPKETPRPTFMAHLKEDRRDFEGVFKTHEARNTPFFPSQEKSHTVVLRGVRNISEVP